MLTIEDVQRELAALRLYRGAIDGDFGQGSRKAVLAGLDALTEARGVKPVPSVPQPAKPSGGEILAVSAQPRTHRRIEEIIIHCTATPECRDVSVETIRSWHVGQGWKNIGYHFVVALDGTVRPGRPEAEIGSHVAGHNTGTLGVVYVGGVATDGKTPKDTRTPAQKAALLATVKALITKYPTIKRVTGHNQYAAKACPSFDVRRDPLGHLAG